MPGLLPAQQNYGTILGTVSDTSGAVIGDAKIKVVNAATGLSRTTLSDKNGYFRVLSLPIGDYILQVEKPGFKKELTQAKRLEINQNLEISVTLQVGTI